MMKCVHLYISYLIFTVLDFERSDSHRFEHLRLGGTGGGSIFFLFLGGLILLVSLSMTLRFCL